MINVPPSPQKIPPDQTEIREVLRWGADHSGITREIPNVNLRDWTLDISGDVENPLQLDWQDLTELPSAISASDFHCVEGWSVLGCKWEGVHFETIIVETRPRKEAKYVTFECSDGYTTSLSIEELLSDNVLLAYKLNGQQLEKGYGFPLRLVVPSKYSYKSAMWIKGIRFTSKKELGYWERRGYSDSADVWTNDRFSKQ